MRTSLPGVDEGAVRLLRRVEYDHLVELGAFERERVELVHGIVVRMTPQGPPHAAPIGRLTAVLVARLGDRALVRVQLPLNGPGDSEPEPDVAVVAPGDHDVAHPSAAHLVVEVSLSSLPYDRGTKAPLYAAMGVPEYWIVDVVAGVIEIHTEPSASGYASQRTARRGETIHLLAFPDAAIEVSAIVRGPP